MPLPTALPIDPHLPTITAAALEHRCVVLSAEPGTGKTTRVPGALVDAGIRGQVVVLEPRRVAARAAARRVAMERGSTLGGEVGYQVRHERRTSSSTRVRFATEGVLVRQIVQDPTLPGIGAVVVDEFHERHLEGDLALGMLRDVRDTVRPDLVLAVMSATLDVAPLRAFLGSCAVLEVPGRAHAVTTTYFGGDRGEGLERRVAQAVRRALSETEGDVLVFLPGVREIAAVAQALRSQAGVLVLPLHGQLEAEDQDRAISRQAQRRVVLATNVAESSVTVEGVTAVVDTGLVRRPRHDPHRGLDTLRLEAVSLASAEQRRGRAGRERPGVCYRLWDRGEERARAAHEPAEVTRVDISGAVLSVRAFAAGPASAFGWFEHPGAARVEAAEALLRRLGALPREGERLTPLGERMLGEPLQPRLARMLLEAQARGCRGAAAGLAALLSEREVGERGARGVPVEVVEQWHWVREAARASSAAAVRAMGLVPSAVRAVARAAEQIAGRGGDDGDVDDAELGRALLVGFPDRVALRVSGEPERAQMVGGVALRLGAEVAAAAEPLFLALVVDDDQRPGARAQVRLIANLDPSWLDDMFAPWIECDERVEFDPQRGKVVALRRRRFLDLVLEESRGGEPDPVAAAALLGEVLRADPWRYLRDAQALQTWLGRLVWLRSAAPSLGLPAFDDAAVAAAAVESLGGRGHLGELRAAQVRAVLEGLLPGATRAALEQHAPERVRLPSGRSALIDYAAPAGPTVAVLIQELFGLGAVPALAKGAVPVVVELLAPNRRPVQVTRDLASFWDNVYPQVRSELRRRYPKHSWPEDPRTAPPSSGPRRRRP